MKNFLVALLIIFFTNVANSQILGNYTLEVNGHVIPDGSGNNEIVVYAGCNCPVNIKISGILPQYLPSSVLQLKRNGDAVDMNDEKKPPSFPTYQIINLNDFCANGITFTTRNGGTIELFYFDASSNVLSTGLRVRIVRDPRMQPCGVCDWDPNGEDPINPPPVIGN